MKVPNDTYLNRLMQWRNTLQKIVVLAKAGKEKCPQEALDEIAKECKDSIHATDRLIKVLENALPDK